MLQSLITYAIVLLAFVYIAYRIRKSILKPKHCSSGCDGCSQKSTCRRPVDQNKDH